MISCSFFLLELQWKKERDVDVLILLNFLLFWIFYDVSLIFNFFDASKLLHCWSKWNMKMVTSFSIMFPNWVLQMDIIPCNKEVLQLNLRRINFMFWRYLIWVWCGDVSDVFICNFTCNMTMLNFLKIYFFLSKRKVLLNIFIVSIKIFHLYLFIERKSKE